jgi:hypothetical protein
MNCCSWLARSADFCSHASLDLTAYSLYFLTKLHGPHSSSAGSTQSDNRTIGQLDNQTVCCAAVRQQWLMHRTCQQLRHSLRLPMSAPLNTSNNSHTSPLIVESLKYRLPFEYNRRVSSGIGLWPLCMLVSSRWVSMKQMLQRRRTRSSMSMIATKTWATIKATCMRATTTSVKTTEESAPTALYVCLQQLKQN